MKITADRLDDIIRERDEYDAETAKYADKYDAQYKEYRKAAHSKRLDLEKKVLDIIGDTPLAIEIKVSESFRNNGAYDITVGCNSNDHFNANKALTWEWSIGTDSEGNIIKESNSWSGLKAVTEVQMNDLKESVRILEILNTVDWSDVLNSKTPNLYDYVDEENSRISRERKHNRKDYDSIILQAEIEDAADAGQYIKTRGALNEYYYNHTVAWCRIISKTPKFYNIGVLTSYSIANYKTNGGLLSDYEATERIKQDKFAQLVVKPIEVKTPNQLSQED